MAEKGTTDFPFQPETRGPARGRAGENTDLNATAAGSLAAATQFTTPTIPTRPDTAEPRSRSGSPAVTTTPVRNRDPAPRHPSLLQAASNPLLISQHQLAPGAADASTPDPSQDPSQKAFATKLKKQVTKKKASAQERARDRRRIVSRHVSEEAERQPYGSGAAELLADEELHVEGQFNSIIEVLEAESLALSNRTSMDRDRVSRASEDVDTINRESMGGKLPHVEAEDAATEAQEAAVGHEADIQRELSPECDQRRKDMGWHHAAEEDLFIWGDHIRLEDGLSSKDSVTTKLDPRTFPNEHPAWTGRSLLWAKIASSGILEQCLLSPLPGEPLPEIFGFFMSAEDREEMADVELSASGTTASTAASVVDSLDTEAFLEGLSDEIMVATPSPDLPSNML